MNIRYRIPHKLFGSICLLSGLLLYACTSRNTQTSTVETTTSSPNIIFILADDLGYGDLRKYGASFPTPNLDRMADEGLRLTNFYAEPACTPSRTALLTGCYPQRVGIPWVVGPKGPAWTADKYRIGLHPDEETLPELLKQNGYVTACIGKWHIGHLPEHLPTQHGFDSYFGIPYSNDMLPANSPEWPDLPLMEGSKVIELNPDQAQLTRRYTERAATFINSHREKPFFLYVALAMPHVPIFASDAFAGKSGKGLYADVVQEIDWSVGEILRALKANGLDENTLVIFTSDNGPWLTYGNHAGSSSGLREGKVTTFEGGVRVPMIARWPGRIKAGSVSPAVAGLYDVLPTLAELAQSPRPALPIDGKSFARVLLDTDTMAVSDAPKYYYNVHELQAVRVGNWKLHQPHTYQSVLAPGQDGNRGKEEIKSLELSLYDLEADPQEQMNVADQYPDIVAKLSGMMETFAKELEANKRKPGIASEEKEIGSK